MICPYCGKEMRSGSIFCRSVLTWEYDDEGKPIDWMDQPWFAGRYDISSKDTSFWNYTIGLPGHYSAYHCPDCQKFIFDGELI